MSGRPLNTIPLAGISGIPLLMDCLATGPAPCLAAPPAEGPVRAIFCAAIVVLLAGSAAAQVDGTYYTVVAPVFRGAGNNHSFLRLGNIGNAHTTVTVTVVGSASGENYGTAEFTVRRKTSPQYSVEDILNEAGITGLAEDEPISLYLHSSDEDNPPVFQHAVWNSMTGFFENAGRCTYREGIDYSRLNTALTNVHTSRIAEYPATLFLHNYADKRVTYRAHVYDARNAMSLGSTDFELMANETRAVDFSEIEEDIAFEPASDQFHANIVFEVLGRADYALSAVQGIRNLQLDAYINMSAACIVNPSEAPPDPDADDHGNTRNEATLISVPSTTDGNLEKTGDVDYFRLRVRESGTLLISVSGSTDTRQSLQDSTGTTLETEFSNRLFDIEREVEPGTYYIRIAGSFRLDTGTYRLRVSFTPLDAEPAQDCRVDLVVGPGESCTYPGTDERFRVGSDGVASFLGRTYGSSGSFSTTTSRNGRIFRLSARTDSRGMWRITRVG